MLDRNPRYRLLWMFVVLLRGGGGGRSCYCCCHQLRYHCPTLPHHRCPTMPHHQSASCPCCFLCSFCIFPYLGCHCLLCCLCLSYCSLLCFLHFPCPSAFLSLFFLDPSLFCHSSGCTGIDRSSVLNLLVTWFLVNTSSCLCCLRTAKLFLEDGILCCMDKTCFGNLFQILGVGRCVRVQHVAKSSFQCPNRKRCHKHQFRRLCLYCQRGC